MIATVLFMTMWSVLPGQATTSAPQTTGAPPTTSAIQTPGVYRPGTGITPPVLVKEFKPQYTAAAMRARIQGTVLMECVVGIDGSVGEARVIRSLDAGLDEEAIKAAKQWRFKPGMKDGQAVAVLITLELTFTLRDKRPASVTPPSFLAVPAPAPVAAPSTANPTAQADVYTPGHGVVAPVLLKDVKPQYPPAAKAAGIQGIVTLECVVEIDGGVGEVRVVAGLDTALDEEAIKAAKQWRFTPGTKDGQPVRVRISLEMTFTLR